MSKAPRPRVRKPCVFLQNYSVVTTWDTGGDRSSLRHLPGRDVAQGEDVCLRLRVRTRQNLRGRVTAHSPQPSAKAFGPPTAPRGRKRATAVSSEGPGGRAVPAATVS